MSKIPKDVFFNQELDGELKKILEPAFDIMPKKKQIEAWKSALRDPSKTEITSEKTRMKIKKWKLNPWAIGFFFNAVAAMVVLLILPLPASKNIGQALRLEFSASKKTALLEELKQFSWLVQRARILDEGNSQMTLLIASQENRLLRDAVRQLSRQGLLERAEHAPLYDERRKSLFEHFFPGKHELFLSDEAMIPFLVEAFPELKDAPIKLVEIEEVSLPTAAEINSATKGTSSDYPRPFFPISANPVKHDPQKSKGGN